MPQITRSCVKHDAGKAVRARQLGQEPPESTARYDLRLLGEFPGASARSRVQAERRAGSSSSPRNLRLGSRPVSQAMRWIGRRKADRSSATAKLSFVSIIDDDRWSREGMNCYLDSCGYNCAAFCTAEEYLSANAMAETACLVADVQLPGMKGPELQERLIAEGYRIPIIFVTGYFDDRTRDRVLRAGAIAYLTKPWCETTLTGCLEKAFGFEPGRSARNHPGR